MSSLYTYIEAKDLKLQPAHDGYGSAGNFLRIELEMTLKQRKAAIVELLGSGWGESEAFEWFESEFGEWVAEWKKVTA